MPSDAPRLRVLYTTFAATCAKPKVINAKYTPFDLNAMKLATQPKMAEAIVTIKIARANEGASSFSISADK